MIRSTVEFLTHEFPYTVIDTLRLRVISLAIRAEGKLKNLLVKFYVRQFNDCRLRDISILVYVDSRKFIIEMSFLS